MLTCLFAAQSSPYQILITKIVMAIVGLVMIGVGYYAIRNKRLLMSRRQRSFMRLFGVEEITGRWATIGGAVQLLTGVVLLALPVAGPYLGIFTEKGRRPSRYNAYKSSGSQSFEEAKARMEADMRAHFVDSEDEFDSLPPLGNPEQPLPPIDAGEDAEFVVSTKMFGHSGGLDAVVTELADAGGVLVGLRATVKTKFPRSITSLTPIFQGRGNYQLGEMHGEEIGKPFESLAKPGFVATGVKLSDHGIKGLQLRFQRMLDDGSLADATETYWGDWVGEEVRRPESVTFAGPIKGVTLGINDFPHAEIEAIGFAYISSELKALTQPASAPLPVLDNDVTVESLGGAAERRGHFFYQDQAPAGGMLVGVQVLLKDRGAGQVASIRPIYLTGTKYTFGKRHGDVAGDRLLLAREGYAVSGLKMPSFARGLQLQFSKVLPTGQLDSSDSYTSRRVGDSGDHVNLDSKGMPVIGFSYLIEEHMERLVQPGFAVAKLETTPIASVNSESSAAEEGDTVSDTDSGTGSEPEGGADAASAMQSVVRTWTSKNGKQVEAELIGFEAATKKFILRRVSDDREVKIPANAFAEQDRDILKSWWLEFRKQN